MTESDLRQNIKETFAKVWAEEDIEAELPALEDNTVLLETGLDSLGFAVFVSELEDVLGYDPFALDTEAFYPRTFGEFVAFYARHADGAKVDL